MLPGVAVAAILILDAIAGAAAWPIVVKGLLDEPAHLLTAWLVLTALPSEVTPLWFRRRVFVGAVVIDLDHLPLYFWDHGFAVNDGRPPTHSLFVVVLLLVLGTARPFRQWALGLAVGALLHFVRDVATGPGIPLLWPIDELNVLVPHPAYAVAMALLAMVAVRRDPYGPASTTLRKPHPVQPPTTE
jgi:inner membrane protein